MVMEGGRRVIKPMRYQCRPAGKPSSYDAKYPGTYNARRDNLEGFWKGQFGYTHGIMVVNAFYENVNRHRSEGRELSDGEVVQNVVLEFQPKPTQNMLVACLWSHWTGPISPTCCRLPPSPMNRRLKFHLQAMTVASFLFDLTTSMPGSIPIRQT